jgi:hypothetical protein
VSMTNSADRVEIITSVQRRWRWTAPEKVRMVTVISHGYGMKKKKEMMVLVRSCTYCKESLMAA